MITAFFVPSLALRKLVACTEGIRNCFTLDDAAPRSFDTGVETREEGSIIRVVRMTKSSVGEGTPLAAPLSDATKRPVPLSETLPQKVSVCVCVCV